MAKGKPRLDNETHFNYCLGRALGWWNHVEDGLGDVFCATFGSINHLAARGAYLAVVNFNARFKMTSAAVTASNLPDSLKQRWKTLGNKADSKSEIRNKLIHFSRLEAKTAKGEPAIFLLPNFWTGDEWVAALKGKGPKYTWPQIWEYGESFGDLAIELQRLASEIEAHMRARPPEFPPSKPRPVP